MDIFDKKAWLKHHGDTSQEGWNDDLIHITWIPKGYPLKYVEAFGKTLEEAYNNLYDNVKLVLYTLCEL